MFEGRFELVVGGDGASREAEGHRYDVDLPDVYCVENGLGNGGWGGWCSTVGDFGDVDVRVGA